ncbi:MAG: glucan ABC transporter ATP-binding protein/ permease [Hyphomicrobiaceae bacterium]
MSAPPQAPSPPAGAWTLYLRALGLLRSERTLAACLIAAGMAIAIIQVIEQQLFGRVVDALAKGNEAISIIGLWAALGLVGIVASVVVAVAADRLSHRRRLGAMSSAFEQAITLPISYHSRKGSGTVVRAILAGTDALFWLWLSFLREQLTALIGIAYLIPVAIAMDWRMTSILGVLAIVYVLVNLAVVHLTSAGQAAVEQYHSNVFGQVGDVLGNVAVVQAFSRHGKEMRAMQDIIAKLLAAQYPVLTWWGLLTVLTRSAATIAMLTVFTFGAYLSAKGEISVGEIVTFVGFAQLMISKLDQLSAFVIRVNQQAPTLRTYFDLLDTPPEVIERPDAVELDNVKGDVLFENVSFRYGAGTMGIFDISLKADQGQTIALVGPTGSGKTTTLALLQRIRETQSGEIKIDGINIADTTLSSLRRCMAVVFQEAGLFNRTIAENIRVGRPEATDEEVEQAARLAEAHDFISRKPGGYQFLIGERGAQLSGGERQRIAIARAILMDAPILILDEATSALDPETEAKIKRALDNLRKGRTTFIIAHRLSTVANADTILVLQDGRIIERGRFNELVRQNGLFATLVKEGGFTAPEEDAEPDTKPA